MLLNPDRNVFNWSADNFGSTFTDTGFAVNAPGHANANTKGANTNLLSGIAEDCFGLSIVFSGANSSATIRRQLTDILIDPGAGVGNAGTSWSVLIANLYSNSPAFFAYQYYFPIFLKAGTAIGAAHQDLVAGTLGLRVGIRVLGRPSRPELMMCGSKVQTLGAVTATTSGAAVTPGTGALGAYSASLGTLSSDAWWWQVGVGSNDTTISTNYYLFDVAVNATNKLICAQGVPYGALSTAEQVFKGSVGNELPVRPVLLGEDVYVRGTAAAAPDGTMTAIAYALGG